MIRLTLILTAGIVAAMLIYGTEDPELARAPIAETVLEDGTPKTVPAEAVAPVFEAPVVEAAIDAEPPEVTRRQGLDLSKPQLVMLVNANDAPADAKPQTALAAETAPDAQRGQDVVYVTGTRVNLRAGPSTGHDVLGRLGRGDVAVVLGQRPDGWMRIRDIETGTVGFMSGDFLSPSDPTG